MFTTMNSGKALFALICVVFSLFSIIGCDEDGKIQAPQTALTQAEKRAQNAEAKLKRVEAELKQITPENVQKYITVLEKLVEKLPRAIIDDVQLERKKKSMNITAKFHIYNRKGIEGSVEVSFYLQEDLALKDKNGYKIIIRKKFTPKDVEDTLIVKLSMSDAELNVKQPRDLKFILRIYDKPTNTFLEEKPYSRSFHFDPFKD